MTDLELVTQQTKVIYLKISLLDSAYQEIEQLQGEMVELSLTADGDSDIRRVSTLVMHIDDAMELATNYFGIWMDRMVWLSYGIFDNETNNIKWWLLGSFLFSASSYTFDVSNHQLSLSLVDMMAAATQERGSQVGYGIKFPAGSSISNALQATVARFSPYKECNICEFEDVIPYDIEGAMGSYPITVLKSLVSLFSWYEQFYSRDGVYTVRRIPTALGESAVMQAEDMEQVIIKEGGNVSYADIKNCTEIWGKEIDPNYTARSCVSSGNTYVLTIHDTYETYEDGALIAFTPDSNSGQAQKMRIGELESYDVLVENGDGTKRKLNSDELVAGVLYVVKYVNEQFILQGEALIHVMCMEYNVMPSDSEILGLKAFHGCENIKFVIDPTSPYACDRIGIVKQVLHDGEYSNIYTTQLAYERATYENWKSTRLQDNITLEALFIPWLDVNQKIEYRSIATGETHQYLIRKIDVNPMSGTMTLTLTRFYPLYPWMSFAVICGQVICGQAICGG